MDHAVAGVDVGGDHGGRAAEDTGRDEDGAVRAVDRDHFHVEGLDGGVDEVQRVRRRDHGAKDVLLEESGDGCILRKHVLEEGLVEGSKRGIGGREDREGARGGGERRVVRPLSVASSAIDLHVVESSFLFSPTPRPTPRPRASASVTITMAMIREFERACERAERVRASASATITMARIHVLELCEGECVRRGERGRRLGWWERTLGGSPFSRSAARHMEAGRSTRARSRRGEEHSEDTRQNR